MGIKNKVTIVTGASTGIGEACAYEFARNGANLIIVARRTDFLNAIAKRICAASGVQVHPVVADLRRDGQPERVVKAAVEKFGTIDILVNNAGRAHLGGLMDTDEQDWEDMIALKFTAMRRLCKAVIPHMRKRGWGRIVNMSSIGGIYSNPKLLVSHTLSAAINNLTKGLALEVAKDGILVNAIGIGAVATDNWAMNMIPGVRKRRPELSSLSNEEIIRRLGEEMTPVGRFGRVEEVAAIAVFLASSRNGFVTGDTIEASGGADRFV